MSAIVFLLYVTMNNSLAIDRLMATNDVWDMRSLARQADQPVSSPAIPQNPERATQGDVLIFVSFSMLKGRLQQWLAQAQHIHAPVVIRGLVNNSFEATQAQIAALIPNNQGGMVLEPRLFSDYQITQVPAVVVRNTAIDCPAAQSCPHIDPFDVVTGDIGLEAALTTIADQSDDAASHIAHQELQRLRQDQ